MDGKLIFERDMALLADGYTQTLEPRMQYLYVPYRDQSNIRTTTPLYCNLTTAACSATVPTAVLTVSLQLTS
jgi:lipopolysaccharide assembly outer membrane protein LptD (OstA)